MATSELEDLLNVVNNQVIQLAYRWKIFGQLFDSGPENIELLNKSGSNVFALFQRLVLDEVMIALSRLTDPEKSAGNENASVRNLRAKANACLETKTIAEVDALIGELDDHVRNLRKHRNKVLAHADLGHALNVSALPPVTYDEIEKAMEALQTIVSKVALESFRWTTHYDSIILYGSGGDSLLEVLRHAHSSGTTNG